MEKWWIRYPAGIVAGTGVGPKDVKFADLDLDGKKEIHADCDSYDNHADPGIFLMKPVESAPPAANAVWSWTQTTVFKHEGKYDLMPLVDFDGDGDLDFATTEENMNYGVICFENPAKKRDSQK